MKLSACTKCPILVGSRTHIIMGTGVADSGIMIIDAAPCGEVDKSGVAFSGEVGKVVDKYLKYLKIDRSTVYLTHVIKCRPTNPDKPKKNRRPSYQEIMECSVWLDKEIERIKPKLIIVLGSIPLERITGLKHITYHHGRAIKVEKYNCYVFPTFSPGQLMYCPKEMLPKIQEDLKKLREFLKWQKK